MNQNFTEEKGFLNLKSEKEIILNSEEKKIIEQLNSFANKTQEDAIKQSTFYNLSLKDLLDKFLSTWNKIINEVINIYKNISKNQKNQQNQKKGYWWDILKLLFFNIISIITKEDRLIYVGIMLIIISFFLYFLLISS